ncbi:MAG: AAA family ATPase [Bacteroidetes bacterium]|nr:AAA family ATPase [Bacteroidota bacterium]
MNQICSIHLENFKPYGISTEIPTEPLTLIFGANSSGKSSILHAIHLLKQTHDNRNTNDILSPRTENQIVDLGSFREFIFNHDITRKLKIRVNFDLDKGKISYPWEKLPDSQSRGSKINEIAGVELHFEFLPDNQEINLSQLEIFNNQVGSIACFQNHKDALIRPEILDHYESMGGFELLNTSYSRSQYFLGEETESYLCNTAVTESEEYWSLPFSSVKENREQIINYLTERLGLLSQPNQKGIQNNISGLRSVSVFRTPEDAADAKEREEYAQHLEIEALNKAVKFYKSDFVIKDFITRMQSEQHTETLAIFGMLDIRYSGGFPGNFPEYPILYKLDHPTCMHSLSTQAIMLCKALQSILHNVFTLGPLRKFPRRLHKNDGRKPQKVGDSGEFLPDMLIQHPKLVDATNKWLNRLDIAYELQIEKTNISNDVIYEIRFVDTTNNSVDINLNDLGFGISQILPVVVQCIASCGKILTIQQPELHIHPSLQANLGDLFTESIYTHQNQLIIETHSEHLVLRLLRLVRKGKLKHDDISILYVGRNPTGTYVKRLCLDENGDFLDHWPGGFFPERLNEYL